MQNYIIKSVFVVMLFATLLESKLLEFNVKPDSLKSDRYMGIRILDSKEVKFKKMDEISALAMKDNKLFALSDKGELYTFKIKIKKNKIKKLKLIESKKLKDENSKKLSKKNSDSEGMILVDNKLFISFEKNHRVESYSLGAKRIKKLKINKKLTKMKNYKSGNKGLEALAYNEKYGLITAPETPKDNRKYHTLYAKNKRWKFKINGDIKGLEFINKDELLVMQRDFNSKKNEMKIVLNIINLSNCSGKKVCKNKILAKLKTKDGWKLYNFEGLTKVSKNRFLIVSDNHGSKSQKTVLVLFEIE